MRELNDFYNAGFGWTCRHCERDLAPQKTERPRLMREGESEGKVPRMSNVALARWADPGQTTLTCPRCGITEPVSRS